MTKMSRRAWLGGTAATLGAAALPMPLFEAFGPSAQAQSRAPKRFIAVKGALGIKMRRWVMGNPSSHRFGPGLMPLSRYFDDISIIRGLQPRIGAHGGGSVCFLTGDMLASDSAKHASIDQQIAAINPPSVVAPGGSLVRSIEAGVGVRGRDGRGTMVYQAPGSRLLPKNNPADLFDLLFAGGAPSTPPSVDLSSAHADAQQSIIDAHMAEIDRIRNLGSTEDRVRLDRHLDGLRTIELDIERIRMSGSTPAPECTAPSRYDPGSVLGPAPYDRIANTHSDIIARAFACDLTRVATLQIFYDPSGGINLNFLESRHRGISDKQVHDNKHGGGAASDVIDDFYAESVAHLLDGLNVPDPLDPDGGRILDNTVLFFGSGLANPAHGAGPNYGRYTAGEQDTTDTAYLIAGSAGGYFNTGRMFDHRVPGLYYGENKNKYSAGDGHVYHNRLLVSLANAFGVSTSSVGDPAFSAGGALDGGLLR